MKECNFKTTAEIPILHDHAPTTWTKSYQICMLKPGGFNGKNEPTHCCDGEETCIIWMTNEKKSSILKERERERYEKLGIVFNENGYCIYCGWSRIAKEGCGHCIEKKEEKNQKDRKD